MGVGRGPPALQVNVLGQLQLAVGVMTVTGFEVTTRSSKLANSIVLSKKKKKKN